MRRCRIVLGVTAAAVALLAAGLPAVEPAPDAVVCLKPAWGNSTICLLASE